MVDFARRPVEIAVLRADRCRHHRRSVRRVAPGAVQPDDHRALRHRGDLAQPAARARRTGELRSDNIHGDRRVWQRAVDHATWLQPVGRAHACRHRRVSFRHRDRAGAVAVARALSVDGNLRARSGHLFLRQCRRMADQRHDRDFRHPAARDRRNCAGRCAIVLYPQLGVLRPRADIGTAAGKFAYRSRLARARDQSGDRRGTGHRRAAVPYVGVGDRRGDRIGVRLALRRVHQLRWPGPVRYQHRHHAVPDAVRRRSRLGCRADRRLRFSDHRSATDLRPGAVSEPGVLHLAAGADPGAAVRPVRRRARHDPAADAAAELDPVPGLRPGGRHMPR